MIDPKYYGIKLTDLPDSAFWPGFDPEERWPALVLASLKIVPEGSEEGWLLACEGCGGFSCDSLNAAVLPLSVRPERMAFVEHIADEAFSPEPLDYLGPRASRHAAVREGYLASLHTVGLSCREENLRLLTQALYPVDATPGNLSILSGDPVELSRYQDIPGLVIFIVGQNCD